MTLRWKCLHKWILKSPKVTLKRENTWVRKRCVKIPNNNTSNPSGNNATWNSTRPKYRQFPCIIRVCKRARYKALLEQQKVTAKRSMSWAVYCKMSWQSLPIRTPNHFRTQESSYNRGGLERFPTSSQHSVRYRANSFKYRKYIIIRFFKKKSEINPTLHRWDPAPTSLIISIFKYPLINLAVEIFSFI